MAAGEQALQTEKQEDVALKTGTAGHTTLRTQTDKKCPFVLRCCSCRGWMWLHDARATTRLCFEHGGWILDYPQLDLFTHLLGKGAGSSHTMQVI